MTIKLPIGRTQSVGGHMLPDETTRIGYSVLSASRIPPQTANAPRITNATRKRPLAVSFFLMNFQNLLSELLNVSSQGLGVLLLERAYLGLVLNPPQKLFCCTGACGQKLFSSRRDPVNLPASTTFRFPDCL